MRGGRGGYADLTGADYGIYITTPYKSGEQKTLSDPLPTRNLRLQWASKLDIGEFW